MRKLWGGGDRSHRVATYRQITQSEMLIRRMRVVRAAVYVAAVLVVGSLGFYLLTDEDHSFLECIYMTVITVTTVGYDEVVPVRQSQALTLFTIAVMLVGVGAVLYLLTAVAAMVVEGDLQQRLWRRRMEKRVEKLRDHVIVVGVGRSGTQVIHELFHAGVPFVAVDIDAARLQFLVQDLHMECPLTVGDAMEDTILRSAGVERARGLIAALHDDKDNLFVCLSARHLNPRLRLVAKADDRSSFDKFQRVGVDAIVSPPVMGGRHMASEMLRPDVASFVDGLLRVTESAPALSELRVGTGAPAAGLSLGDANLRSRTNCLILGIRDDDDSFYQYNPGPEVILEADSSVIALGDPVALESLRNLLRPST